MMARDQEESKMQLQRISGSINDRAWLGLPCLLLSLSFASAAEFPSEHISGEWKPAGDQITQSSKDQAVLLAADPALAGYTVRVKVRLSDPQLKAEAGLAIHYRDSENVIVYSIQEKKGGPFVVLRICAKS